MVGSDARAVAEHRVQVRLKAGREFQELFGDVGDGLDLAQRLREWAPEGRYGWVFGEAAVLLVGEVRRFETPIALLLVALGGGVYWWLRRRQPAMRRRRRRAAVPREARVL